MKDDPLFEEKRISKSKEVNVQFINGLFEQFNVLDEKGEIKYFGVITKDMQDDDCSCQSFFYGMQYDKLDDDSKRGESRYVATNGHSFQCKHIIRARSLKMLGLEST